MKVDEKDQVAAVQASSKETPVENAADMDNTLAAWARIETGKGSLANW